MALERRTLPVQKCRQYITFTADRVGPKNAACTLGLLIFFWGGGPAVAQNGPASSEGGSAIPISAELCESMKKSRVLSAGAPVGCDRLKLVKFGYVDFEAKLHRDGEIVVLDAAADHVLKIFEALRIRKFPIAKARLLNEYGGNDDLSMDANNTSAFNFRKVAGSGAISLHSYGVAIDLNPIQNPFIRRSGGKIAISPRGGASYVNRVPRRPGMAELVVDIFAENGFSTWGGDWKNPVDYQHFQVSYRLASQLIRLSSADSQALFARHIERYRACIQMSAKGAATRVSCVAAE